MEANWIWLEVTQYVLYIEQVIVGFADSKTEGFFRKASAQLAGASSRRQSLENWTC